MLRINIDQVQIIQYCSFGSERTAEQLFHLLFPSTFDFPDGKIRPALAYKTKETVLCPVAGLNMEDEILNMGKVLITIIIMRGQLGTRRENTYLHCTKKRCSPGKSL